MARGTGMRSIPTEDSLVLRGLEEKTTLEPTLPITVRVPRVGLLTSEYTPLVPLTGAPQRASSTPVGNLTTVSGEPVKSFIVLVVRLKVNAAAV